MGYSPKEIIKMIEENGWYLDRIRGSHHVYKNDKLQNLYLFPFMEKKIWEKDYFTKY